MKRLEKQNSQFMSQIQTFRKERRTQAREKHETIRQFNQNASRQFLSPDASSVSNLHGGRSNIFTNAESSTRLISKRNSTVDERPVPFLPQISNMLGGLD